MTLGSHDAHLPAGVKITPMLRQWLTAKEKAKDAILLFRMGDFYELFGRDAQIAAPILDLNLTSRDKDKENSVPMAGFPHHAASPYILKLIKEGFKVAICDQMEDPKLTKQIVRREITQIITPSTILEAEGLPRSDCNYLVAVTRDEDAFGIAALELSTGEFLVSRVNQTHTLYTDFPLI